METTLYFDLATKDAYDTLNGGARFSFPPVYYGEALTISGRFATRVAGTQVEVTRNVEEVRASIGRVDAAPETGLVSIKVGLIAAPSVVGTNVTTPLPHNFTAAQLKAALDVLTVVTGTHGISSVTPRHRSFIVSFANNAGAVELSAASNTLFPLSFLRSRSSVITGQHVTEARLIQAPVASTDQSALVVPRGPYFEEVQAGGSNDAGGDWPEIQKLVIPPTFRGLYQVRRAFDKSEVLKAGGEDEDGVEEIAEAVLALADTGGKWVITNPEGNSAHFTATGTMRGLNLDLLTVDVMDAPQGDLTFSINLDTPELAALLAEKASVVLPVEISADLIDDQDEELSRKRVLYRGEITIHRELHWAELSTAASVDWIRPTLPKDYIPFTLDQVSSGQLHYSTTAGNGVLQDFVIDHNLNTDRLTVIIHPNSAAGAPLVYGTDYTYTRTNGNSLEVSFTGTPTSAQYLITVLGLEATSFFDLHTHTIPQIESLQDTLDDLGSRLASLESRAGGGPLSSNTVEDTGESARWTLPDLFEIYPYNGTAIADPLTLRELDTATLTRARGLLPAVHDTAAEDLPGTLPAADTVAGHVYQNNTAATVLLPVGLGHRSRNVKVGEYVASDGRVFYPVTPYGMEDGFTFSTNYAAAASLVTSPGHTFPDGTKLRLTTTGTLPAPLALATDYFATEVDGDAGTLKLSATAGGAPVILTTNGTGVHTVTKVAEVSFYPVQFERTLFTLSVNEKQLRVGKSLDVNFALELVLVAASTSAQWSVVIELGEAEQATSPANVGANLSQLKWRGIPALEQRLIVTPISTVHRFGLRVDRYLSASVEKLRVSRFLYGGTEGGITPPSSANFAVRARLVRFDTEDGETDPRGFAVLKGLTYGTAGNSTDGLATII
jgi:hypothetical protein